MRWRVEGRQVAAGTIGPPPMNYGQHQRWLRYPRVHYRLDVAKAEFLRHLDGFFEELSSVEAQELADGLEADFPALERYREVGFPGLAQLLEGHAELFVALVEIFDLDVLEGLTAPPDASAGLYHALASLERCVLEGDQVVLEGVAYAVPTGPH